MLEFTRGEKPILNFFLQLQDESIFNPTGATSITSKLLAANGVDEITILHADHTIVNGATGEISINFANIDTLLLKFGTVPIQTTVVLGGKPYIFNGFEAIKIYSERLADNDAP